MKLYDTKQAPNPRRVRIFLAEKAIEVESIQMDLQAGDNLSKDYLSKNPFSKVPILELDDGTIISETVAICRYFEELQPQPALMGSDPLQKAHIEMWQRRAEFHFMFPVGMGFQHTSGFFKDRMTPRVDFGEDCIKSAYHFLKLAETHLASSAYLASDSFSIADITFFCALEFGKVINIRLSEKHPNIERWYQQMKQRPSSQA
ncbi:MAG: glutathione S-transferase family protein [Enterobacterales bacterium]|nr:glutathione S-transferase family protein [Enterobacterales bacterium]